LVLHVAPLTSIADYLVISSGDSERQVRAIADHIETVLSEQRVRPLSLEGLTSSRWVVLDFGDVVAHVFRSDVRDHYALDKLWGDAKRLRVPAERVSVGAPTPPDSKKRTVRRVKGR
jgi:ribosome-associated protein